MSAATHIQAVTTPKARELNMVSFVDLANKEPEAPRYTWEGLVPVGVTTLLAAHGGTGKSLVALMLAVNTALGRPMFGLATEPGPVAFFSGEDGASLLRHRLQLICKCMGVEVRELEGRLHIIDATEDPVLFTEISLSGRREGVTTAAFTALSEFVKLHQVSLLIIDNASDTFDASEIDRARVRAYMRALSSLARENDMGLVLLAHVDKGTSRGDRVTNEAYSGSTAWHNSARSRLFMSRDKDGGLLLEHQKNNLGKRMDPLSLMWPTGGVPQINEAFSPAVQQRGTAKPAKHLEQISEDEWDPIQPNSDKAEQSIVPDPLQFVDVGEDWEDVLSGFELRGKK